MYALFVDLEDAILDERVHHLNSEHTKWLTSSWSRAQPPNDMLISGERGAIKHTVVVSLRSL